MVIISPLMLIGEAPGAEEEYRKRPFVGISGTTLNGWLEKTGLKREELLIANTFRYRPEKNEIKRFFRPAGYPNVKLCQDLAPKTGLYLIEHFRPDIEHLKKTLLDFRPEVVITLGATALWAVMNQDISIARFTGPEEKPHFCTVKIGTEFVRFLLLPAYHPAAFLRTKDQTYEDVTLRALKKAKPFFDLHPCEVIMFVEPVKKQLLRIVGNGKQTVFEVEHALGRFVIAQVYKGDYTPVDILPSVIADGKLIYEFGHVLEENEVFNVLVMG